MFRASFSSPENDREAPSRYVEMQMGQANREIASREHKSLTTVHMLCISQWSSVAEADEGADRRFVSGHGFSHAVTTR
jgi:hypothetical protein